MDRLLLLLAAFIDWIARLISGRASQTDPDGPRAPTEEVGAARVPHSRFGGRAWSYDDSGVHADGRLWRTPGEPVTCRAILAHYGEIIFAAAARHGVDPALIVMTIATETGSFRADRFTGPRTFRWEPHVQNLDVAPAFRGSYSAGPMQVLATTARDIVARRSAAYGLDYRPQILAPAFATKPRPVPASLPLYDPATSIDLGAAVIRRGLALTGQDPILVAAAYNSGGIYRSRANAWRLRSHGNHLDRAASWYGDACAVVREIRMAR